jgi:hypothetical protein
LFSYILLYKGWILKSLVYGNCSFVIGEKGVYHKQILEEQTALGYIVLQKGKSEA